MITLPQSVFGSCFSVLSPSHSTFSLSCRFYLLKWIVFRCFCPHINDRAKSRRNSSPRWTMMMMGAAPRSIRTHLYRKLNSFINVNGQEFFFASRFYYYGLRVVKFVEDCTFFGTQVQRARERVICFRVVSCELEDY